MLEISVIGLGLVLMLADLFVPAERRRFIGYAAIAALGVLLVTSLSGNGSCGQFGTAFGGMFVNDALVPVLQTTVHCRGDFGFVHGRGIFRQTRRRQRGGILFAHPFRAGGNVVRRVVQRLHDAVRLHRTHHDHVLRSRQFSTQQTPVARSGREISDSRRAVVVVHGVRHRADLGNDRRTQLHQTRRRCAAVCRQPNFFARRAVGFGRTRLQDRRVSVSDLGAGRLSRRADADDRVSRHRFQSRRICFAAARAVHRRSERDARIGRTCSSSFPASRFFTAISARFRSAISNASSVIPASRTRAICCSASRR